MTELVEHRRRDIAYPDAVGVVNPDKVFHPTFTFGPWIERIGGHALPAEIHRGGAHDQIKLTGIDNGPFDGVASIFDFLMPKWEHANYDFRVQYPRGGGQ